MITVVTPSYNRRQTLDRLWQSLCLQTTNLPFEWLLVDDGSTDDTLAWFEQTNKLAHIKKNYLKQANQGKHVAINTAVKHAAGDWIFIVDSDDELTIDAIETVTRDLVESQHDPNRVGLCYRKSNVDGKLIGKSTPQRGPLRLKPNEAGAMFQGDLAYVFKKTSLAENPFPIISNEKFVPELLIWNRIADNGDILYFPQTAIYRCEYLPDGYSASFKTMLRRNPRGFALFYGDQIRRLKPGVSWAKALIRYCQCLVYTRIKP